MFVQLFGEDMRWNRMVARRNSAQADDFRV
jgi:hypothetical protein